MYLKTLILIFQQNQSQNSKYLAYNVLCFPHSSERRSLLCVYSIILNETTTCD